MKIAVCVKEVPDMESRFKLDTQNHTILEEDLVHKINLFDEFAVEAALQIKEGLNDGSEVIIILMGPERASQTIKKCFAMGGDWGIHLNDPAFDGSDTFVTARVLKNVMNNIKPDLILTGVQAEDNLQSQVGQSLAELLGYVHSTNITKLVLNSDKKSLTINRELESGKEEILELPLPAVLTIQSGINNPRYPSLPGIMKAKTKKLEKWGPGNIGMKNDDVGMKGNLREIVDLFIPESEKEAEIIKGDPKEAAKKLISILHDKEKVI